MKALVGLICDPCLHLFMIALVLASMMTGVAPDDDLVIFAERDASCPICEQTTVHLESCPRSVFRMEPFPPD